MRSPRSLGGLVGVAALVLAGCGGDGSDGGAGVVVVPTPPAAATPTPTPQTPTPTGVAAIPAPFGLTADREFTLLGLTFGAEPGPAVSLAAGEAGLRWLADVRGYHAALPGIGAGRLTVSGPISFLTRFTMDGPSGPRPTVTIYLDDGRGYDPAFAAVGLLSWSDVVAPGQSRRGVAAFGIPTMPSDIPTVGEVAYLTFGDPAGNALVTVNFASESLNGFLGIAWTDAWGPYPATRYPLIRGRLLRDESGFAAEFDIPGAPTGGALVGRFFGLGGRELAIAWTGWVLNPYTNAWERTSDVWIGRPFDTLGS